MAEAALEAGRADDLIGAVELRRDAEATLARRRGRWARPRRARGVGGRRPGTQERETRSSGERADGTAARPRRVNSSRGRFSGRRTGSRRRTETTDEPAASAFSHSVAAAMPAPSDLDSVGVRVRPVGVHGAGVALEARRERSGPGGPGASRTCAKTPRPSTSKPPSTAAHALDARRVGSSRPSRCARAAPRRARGTPRRSGCSGRTTERSRGSGERRRRAARTARPGNVVGPQWPSLSERIRRWRIAAARTRHAPAGSGSVPNTAISAGSSPPFRRVAYAHEAGEPAADDRARSRHGYLTEPARSPWTK